MRDIDDLRRALHAETAELTLDMSPERIRGRVRSLRIRRSATTAVASAFVVAVLSVSYAVAASPARAPTAGADPEPTTSVQCLRPGGWFGRMTDTGVTIDAPERGTRYGVGLVLVGGREPEALDVGFNVPSDPDRGYAMSRVSRGPAARFVSGQIDLRSGRVLDVGAYAGAAARITVAVEGRSVGAHIADNGSGWTLFWAERAGHLLASGDQFTLAAYDAEGRVLDVITGGDGIGAIVPNPRDTQPDWRSDPTATPTPAPVEPTATPSPESTPTPLPPLRCPTRIFTISPRPR